MEIEGFKAFAARQSFEFGGHVFVFGKNGLGKSSVVEAIRWCLFGLADRPETEVRNVFYSLGDCRVELQLEGPGGRWRIQRRLRPGSGKSDQVIHDPSGASVQQSEVFPHLARLGPREGTHIIFASQQSTRRRPQADITDFDKVLYSYLRIEDVPDLLHRLKQEIQDQAEIERKLAEEVEDAEQRIRSEVEELDNRIQENLAAAPWGPTIPTNDETDARIRRFVEECGRSPERSDGRPVTREWLLAEADRAVQEFSAESEGAVQDRLNKVSAELQELVKAIENLQECTDQLARAQARVETCQRDLENTRGNTSEQQLITERDALARRGDQLERRRRLEDLAVDYFGDFSPEDCPVCDGQVDSADVLSQLQSRIGSDPDTVEPGQLKSVQARLDQIGAARESLETAETAYESAESNEGVARRHLRTLLNDPPDLSNSSHAVDRLREKVQELKLELKESGSLVGARRDALKKLQAEARFHRNRSRKEMLRQRLKSGLGPAREAHGEFNDVLETLRAIYDALQETFNSTLNGTLPQIGALMTEVYDRLTQQASFPKIVLESGRPDAPRTLRVQVTSDRTPGQFFEPAGVLNGQAFNALNLVPYFVFSKFQAEALELDCLLIDDPSQSFDTSRVELLMRELEAAATHAQLIVASHEEDRFRRLIKQHFSSDSYRVFRVTSFAPDVGPTFERVD